jgi:hypothetical protein
MASLTAVLPAATAARVDATLEAAARSARSAGDPRTLDQLRADGLSDLVLHTACTAGATAGDGDGAAPDAAGGPALVGTTAGPGAGATPGLDDRTACRCSTRTGCGAAPHHRTEIRVTVALSTLLGADDDPAHLAGIGALDATTARALAAGGVWRRLVTDPTSGTVLDVGRTTYRPPRALARHVRARDQVCARPGCPATAESCDLDHTIAFHDPPDGQDPGATADHNLGPLCRRDHRLKTDGGFVLRQTARGRYVWTTPGGHQYLDVPGADGLHRHLGRVGAMPPGAPPALPPEPSPPSSAEAPLDVATGSHREHDGDTDPRRPTMSTVPGDRSWEDAGLVEPTLTDLPEVAANDPAVPDDPDARDDLRAADGGTYTPDDARPDLIGEADAGDVAEQRAQVPEDERDDYP